MTTSVELLCKQSPVEFAKYLNYCRALLFESKPDYSYLRRLFRDLFFRQKYSTDYRFDWIRKCGRKKSSKNKNEGGPETAAVKKPKQTNNVSDSKCDYNEPHHRELDKCSGDGRDDKAEDVNIEIDNSQLCSKKETITKTTGQSPVLQPEIS